MNCYYSNLIENHNTTLIDIDRAPKSYLAFGILVALDKEGEAGTCPEAKHQFDANENLEVELLGGGYRKRQRLHFIR